MKLKITLHLCFALLLIFSCSQDELALSTNFNKSELLEHKLVNHTWKHTEKIDDKFTQKAEIQFFANGSLLKKDSYNYIGIEEHFEELGRWYIEPNGKELTIKMKNTKSIQVYRILNTDGKTIELVSENQEKRFLLTKA